MKLAEALILRSDLQKRFEQVKYRLASNSKIQEGEEPAEQPAGLLKEMDTLLGQLALLIQQINRTNNTVRLDDTRTLADGLVERDILSMRRQALTELAQSASIRQDRFTRTEVRFISTVDVGELQREADRLAKTYRELDTRIQEMNWLTTLLD
ncbi:DIP1984 family protein [Paenibacillus wulumuqiensis]|uniref:DIP1984 family protein n=1 Tax=Paenibacillus wulumuqiensis TaxID=1567107 RepID=UPI00061988F6|nr:DIP1984 family protein [Paenibacillus wulumuqiensis]